MTLPVETLKSVPRGKAVWNANGGFVSVLLTHLLLLFFNALGSKNPIIIIIIIIILIDFRLTVLLYKLTASTRPTDLHSHLNQNHTCIHKLHVEIRI